MRGFALRLLNEPTRGDKYMEYSKVAESSFAPDTKSFDVRLMLSYVVVSVLLLIAIYALSVHPETNPAEFVSTVVFP
jgi:hypothetical protein